MNQDREKHMKSKTSLIDWDKDRYDLFLKDLVSFKDEKSILFTTRIVNTNYEVLAVKSINMKKLIKLVSKTNIESFLKEVSFRYFEEQMIYAGLISHLDDFINIEKHLDFLSLKIDNWAAVDTINFKDIAKKHEEKLFLLALRYIKEKLTFRRRIAIRILFAYIDNDKYLGKIYNILNQLYKEEEYYVNMAASWILCEIFIKRREETLEFLKKAKLNNFVSNTWVQKSRDSFRVSDEDKEMLLAYKVKK